VRVAHGTGGCRGRCATLIAAGLLAAAGEAPAFFDDRIDLIVEERITYDSNVFRIPDGRTPPALAGSRRGDLSATTSVGLNFDVPYSRQRFQGGLILNDTRYRHLSDLDFRGHDGRALWSWQVGRDWSGQLGYSNVETLGSFANDFIKTPNKVKTEEMLFNGGYLVTPYWRLAAGLNRREQSNSEPTRRVNDIEIVATELSLTHISRAKNQVGISVRHEDGSYPNPFFVIGFPAPIDNGYQQKSIGVFTDWTLTGRSRVTARLDHVSRSYEQLSQRDFDGFTARAAHDWKPTGRLVVVTTVQRDISAVEEINTSFVRVTGASVRPTLTLTGRTTLSGAVEYAIRDYLGDPLLVATPLPQRTDKVFSAAATLTWQVDRVLTVLLAVQHERRTSNFFANEYDVNLVSLSGRMRF
jgi:exopolysaccharide biosynthesis operon protein EpsL